MTALLILSAATVGGMFLGVGLDKLAWETGFTDGDSGMEIIGYLIIGTVIGVCVGAFLAGGYVRRTR